MLGEDRRKIPFFVIIFLVAGVLEIVGLGLIAPYFSIVLSSETDVLSSLSSFLSPLELSLGKQDLIIYVGIGLLLVFVVKGLVSVYINYLILRFSAYRQARLKSFLMEAYQSVSYSKYVERNSSEYIQTIQTLTAVFANSVVLPGLRLISDALVALSILVILMVLNWQAVLLLSLLAALGLFLYDYVFKAKLARYGTELTLAGEKVTQGIQEGIIGLKEIRILGKEDYFLEMVRTGSIVNAKIGIKRGVISSAFRYLFEIVIIFFLVGLVTYVVFQKENGQIQLGILAAFGVATIRLTPLLNSMAQALVEIRVSKYPVKRLFDDLAEMEGFGPAIQTCSPSPTRDDEFRTLSLRGIEFSYHNGSKVLRKIDLNVAAGDSIGIMGSSGVGKSTLLDVLLGLLEPQSGEIVVNGNLLKDSIRDWHSMVAYIPQDTFCLDGSVSANICLESPTPSERDSKLSRAVRQARLDSLISGLEGGIDTKIGEKGVKISGGQKQRMALARALYHDRSVLILDEATSALDEETEKQIVEEIRFLKGTKTIIVVAHRESTLKYCDRIYELVDGILVEKEMNSFHEDLD